MAFAQSNLHISRPLSDLVISYDPAQDGMLRNFFFPRKPVDKLTNQIRQISKADLLRLYDMKAASDSKVAEVQFRTDSTLTYNAQPYAVQAVLSELEELNADEELQYEQRMTMQAFSSMSVNLEYQAINNVLRSTSVMTQNSTSSAAARWDNYTSSSSDPIADLLSAITLVQLQTGKKFNRLAMGQYTWRKLQQHPNVLSRVQFQTGSAGSILTTKILADILDIEGGESNIMISPATYTYTRQGETNGFRQFIGSDVLIARVEDPSLSDFGLGHEFAFSGFNGDGFAALKIPDPTRGVLGAELLKIVSMVDYKVLNPTAGYLLKGVLNTGAAEYNGFID
jgi:hypothetical protein